MMTVLIFILLLVIVRYFEYKTFIKRVLRFAHLYDCRFASEQLIKNGNDKYIIDMLNNKYFRNSDWSMINHFAKKTPSFTKTLFMFKLLNVENIYNNNIIMDLKYYKVI